MRWTMRYSHACMPVSREWGSLCWRIACRDCWERRCLPWTAPAGDVLAAVYRASRGAPTFFGVDGYQTARGSEITAGVLTTRETEVLALLVQGKKYAQIGGELHMSPETARKHTSRICRKLGKHRLELVGMALPNAVGGRRS
jgi:DNA-binding CsgD family transcriptional regulator